MVKRTGSVQITMLFPQDLAERFDALSKETRVSKAAYLREGLEYILKTYEKPNKKTKKTAR